MGIGSYAPLGQGTHSPYRSPRGSLVPLHFTTTPLVSLPYGPVHSFPPMRTAWSLSPSLFSPGSFPSCPSLTLGPVRSLTYAWPVPTGYTVPLGTYGQGLKVPTGEPEVSRRDRVTEG